MYNVSLFIFTSIDYLQKHIPSLLGRTNYVLQASNLFNSKIELRLISGLERGEGLKRITGTERCYL